MNSNTKTALTILTTAVITTVIVGGFMYYTGNTPDKRLSQNNVKATIQEKTSYTTTQIDTFLNDIRKKTGDQINTVNTLQSNTNPETIYVTTVSPINGQWSTELSINNIYSYNTKTGILSKLYSEQESQTLNTIGIEGGKLILVRTQIDNSPHPCTTFWGDNYTFVYFDLTNQQAGLKTYTVPEYQIKKSEQTTRDCEIDLSK